MLEGPYKTGLTDRIYKRFGEDECMVVRLDAGLMQGIPDMGILFRGGFWATLEAKTSMNARRQPNQAWFVDKMNGLCFAAFICPENEEAVLNELEEELQTYWASRIS